LDHSKIRICYDTLELSGKAKETLPEEALALLDGQFGDIKVRIFAVKKLSQLTDSQIALFMPQLIQALKYELFHQSPLSEFLLEKALNNTRVVGHVFFWNLKANLS
jgi:phosphatidylinositol-4,5-bisphosphate 3-kinase